MGDLGAATFAELDRFTQSYVQAMFWTSGYLEPFQDNLSFEQLDSASLAAMKVDCKNFQEGNAKLLEIAYRQHGYDASNAGYDFALSRNGHGAGYFDRKALEVEAMFGITVGDALQAAARAAGESNCYTVPEIEDDNGMRLPDIDVSEVEVFYGF